MIPVAEDNETSLHPVKYSHGYNQSLKPYIRELLVESTLCVGGNKIRELHLPKLGFL